MTGIALTRRNLAVLAAERGDHAEAERLWNDVLAQCPDNRQALANLYQARARPAVAAEG